MQRFQAAITPQRALRALRDLCPSTPVYCVASAVHAVKPFPPRGRAIIIVFSSQMPLQKVQSYNTFNGALSTAVEKIEFFRPKSQFMSDGAQYFRCISGLFSYRFTGKDQIRNDNHLGRYSFPIPVRLGG